MWTYKIVSLNMPADWIEVQVEFTTPTNSTFTKMYSMSSPMTEAQINSFIDTQITKLEELSTSYGILSGMLGDEITVGGE